MIIIRQKELENITFPGKNQEVPGKRFLNFTLHGDHLVFSNTAACADSLGTDQDPGLLIFNDHLS